MSVYVDNARIPARVGRINGRWSHPTADTMGAACFDAAPLDAVLPPAYRVVPGR